MESKFADRRQRDNSVGMLRVKMSRRRSQTQKENRERTVNTRRQLPRILELECSTLDARPSTDASLVAPNPVKTRTQTKCSAIEERAKMLARYKEAKELKKEKEKREKEKKGVFKVGLFRPAADFIFVPLHNDPAARRPLQTATNRKAAAVTAPAVIPGGRVTRSTRNKVLEPPTEGVAASCAAAQKVLTAAPAVKTTRSRAAVPKPPPATIAASGEPAPRAHFTRSSSQVQTVKSTGTRPPPAAGDAGKKTTAPSPGRGQKSGDAQKTKKTANFLGYRRDGAVDRAVVPRPPQAPVPDLPSFAPQDFTFQPPQGLSSFQPTPLSPRSAEAFLTPTFSITPALFTFTTEASVPPQSISPLFSPPNAPSPFMAPEDPQNDVAYFRSVMDKETAKLTQLCDQWAPRVDDAGIPEEMRDRMRTAVGQARLLMKERFGQFSGLVDDCELGRGEKVTTCTDLQGFWEMIYFQVEDVDRKFVALSEAESRGWQEEQRPPPRQRKLAKKPPVAAAASDPSQGPGAGTVGKSRLAAIKAAAKAKMAAAEAEKAAQAAGSAVDNLDSQAPQEKAQEPEQSQETVVFNGGFFQVESPARLSGPVRRSSRLLPQASPCPSSSLSTPARMRRSNAASPFMALPRTPARQTPARLTRTSACLTPANPLPRVDMEQRAELSTPSADPPVPPEEPQKDVAYFRSVMDRETARLTELSDQWAPRVDDASIPEEMRDRMRTAVGQARLLMKERFGQFSGLVDDCELGRGEKVTTCTDLQGFWEMIYYQVEDVDRKFTALREAESGGWQEEKKPLPRQRKLVKKPPGAAVSDPSRGPGASTAAKSRLAAIKAAMKAKMAAAEAEKAAQAAGTAADDLPPQEKARNPEQSQEAVVFNGGFFKVESPARHSGPVRRSSRRSNAALPQASPRSGLSTPARTRRSAAASPFLALPRTPARLAPAQTPVLARTPQPTSEMVSGQDGISVLERLNPEPNGVLAVLLTPARQQRATAPEAHNNASPSLTTSLYPSLPLSPSSPCLASSSPTGSPTLSFSPCPPHSAPAGGDHLPAQLSSPAHLPAQLSSPAHFSSPAVGHRSLVDADVMEVTQDGSIVQNVPTPDFLQRYLQPMVRSSLSPQGSVTMSPVAPDVEMESPAAPLGEMLEEPQTPTEFPRVPHMLTSGTPQAAEGYLMMFSPERERIRQSVCPSDLMVFTPPLPRI